MGGPNEDHYNINIEDVIEVRIESLNSFPFDFSREAYAAYKKIHGGDFGDFVAHQEKQYIEYCQT